MKRFSRPSMAWILSIFVLSAPGPDLKAEETSSVQSTAVYRRVKSGIDALRVVDNHEHLKPESFRIHEGKPDFFDLVTADYTGGDIANSGNAFGRDRKYLDETLGVEERWASFKPVYDRIKNTGYMRCLRLGIKKLHGLDISDAASIKRINESMDRLYRQGLYTKALRELGKIDYVLVYRNYDRFDRDAFPEYFRVVRYVDKMVIFTDPLEIRKLEDQYQVRIHSVDDLELIYDKFVDQSVSDGVVGFKYAGAYYRSLDFTSFSREKADGVLKSLLRYAGGPGLKRSALTVEDGQALTDYGFNLMLKAIEKKAMPVSIHTGLQAGGRADIRWSNPQHLIPLFQEYEKINFDLFHGGFPYVTEFMELGKSWPNVFLNLCWLHTISPEGARSLLSELLECVPVNKILAFGADTNYPESTLGHLEIARENCALVLTEKVLRGHFTEDEAIEYARRILRTNSVELFRLE